MMIDSDYTGVHLYNYTGLKTLGSLSRPPTITNCNYRLYNICYKDGYDNPLITD